MPESMSRMLDQLGVPADKRDFAALDDQLLPDTPLPKPEGVFPRFHEEEGEAEA
jgi:methionyl-tRNA synthetase